MDFKQAYAHYKDGTASEEERRLVEEEIEKYQLIAEHLDAEWETPEIPAPPQEDMKKVRKNLRKRSTATVLTCFILAAALILGAMCAEKFFWNPEEDTYNIEYYNDLDFTLAAYAELFSPGLNVATVRSTRTGFASYDLSIQYWDAARGGDNYFASATLERNKLELPDGLLRPCPANVFERSSYPHYYLSAEYKQEIYETLSDLPDYILVKAAVSFPEDLNMEQLLELNSQLEEGFIVWAGIRNSPEDEQLYPLTGIAPFMGGYVRDGMNEYYPCFDVHFGNVDSEALETHFKSLLQYAQDKAEEGRGLPSSYWNGPYYYETVLDYVEENGVYTYGAYIVGPAQLFLDLLDSGAASQVWMEDAWIDA